MSRRLSVFNQREFLLTLIAQLQLWTIDRKYPPLCGAGKGNFPSEKKRFALRTKSTTRRSKRLHATYYAHTKTDNYNTVLDIKHHQLLAGQLRFFFPVQSFSFPLDFCVTGRWLLVTQTRRDFFSFFFQIPTVFTWLCVETSVCCYVFPSALGLLSQSKPPPTPE